MEHLAKVTGKKTIYLKVQPGPEEQPRSGQNPADQVFVPTKYRSNDEARQAKALTQGFELLRAADEQILALREGQLHVTAFNTGMVPAAVTQGGFHPLYAPASADGKFGYDMRMIVPAGSSIAKPEDVKGKLLALVALSSHTGGKLPLTLLKEKFGLTPGTDYKVVFTSDHGRSIKDVADKKQAVACVAGDRLDAMLAAGDIPAGSVTTIYTSPSFSPPAFGVANTLDPKLRADVQKAFETFAFDGTTIGKLYDGPKRTKFARLDYKKDYADVREVNAKLPTLVGGP